MKCQYWLHSIIINYDELAVGHPDLLRHSEQFSCIMSLLLNV